MHITSSQLQEMTEAKFLIFSHLMYQNVRASLRLSVW